MWLLVSPHGKDDQEEILGITPKGLVKDACLPWVNLYHCQFVSVVVVFPRPMLKSSVF